MEYTINPQTGKLDALGDGVDLSEIENQIDRLNKFTAPITEFSPNGTFPEGKMFFHENKLYVLPENSSVINIYNFSNGEQSSIQLLATRYRYAFAFDGIKYAYSASDAGAVFERINIYTGEVVEMQLSSNANAGGRNIIILHEGEAYIPNNGNTIMHVVDLEAMANLPDVNFPNLSGQNDKYIYALVNDVIYIPSAGSSVTPTALFRYNIATGVADSVVLTRGMRRWNIAWNGNDTLYFTNEATAANTECIVEKYTISTGVAEDTGIRLRSYRRSNLYYYANFLFTPISKIGGSGAITERLMEVINLATKEVVYVNLFNFFVAKASAIAYDNSVIFTVGVSGTISAVNLASVCWQDVSEKQNKIDENLKTPTKFIIDAINYVYNYILSVDINTVPVVSMLWNRQNNFAPILENPDDYSKFIPCAAIYDEVNSRYIICAPNTNPELTFLQNAATVFELITISWSAVIFEFSNDMNTSISEVLFRKLGNPAPESIIGHWEQPSRLYVPFPTFGENVLTAGDTFQFDLSTLQDSNGKSIANFDWKQTFSIQAAELMRTVNLITTGAKFICVKDGDNIYMPQQSGNQIDIFDTSSEIAGAHILPYSNPINRRVAEILNGKIYIPEGTGNRMEIMELSNLAVSTATLPNNHMRRCSAAYENKIYLPQHGGYNLEIFDTENNTTETISLPNNMGRYTCALYGGKLYMPASGANKMEIFDLTAKTTETITLPSSNGRVTCNAYNGKLYMPNSNGADMEIFDLTTNTTQIIGLPNNRLRTCAKIAGDKIFMLSGNQDGAGDNIVEIFDLTTEATQTVVLPAVINVYCFEMIGNTIYAPEWYGNKLHIINPFA